MAMRCHDAYGFQNIAGYLENGIPTQYGFGAESIVMDVHSNGLNKYKWVTDFLGAGDIDRIIVEWRSLLRQTLHSPALGMGALDPFQGIGSARSWMKLNLQPLKTFRRWSMNRNKG